MGKPPSRKRWVGYGIALTVLALILLGGYAWTSRAGRNEAPPACTETCKREWSQCERECQATRALSGREGTETTACDVGCEAAWDACFDTCHDSGTDREDTSAVASLTDEDIHFVYSAKGAAATIALFRRGFGTVQPPEAYADSYETDQTAKVCRELRHAGLVRGCVVATAAGAIGEVRGFVNEQGQVDGLVLRVNGSTRIDDIVAEVARGEGRPCGVVGSPGSRLVAVLGRGMGCDAAPQVRAALDRQSHRTMLACLDLVDAGLVARCEWWVPSLAGVRGEDITEFVGQDQRGGGIVIPDGDAGLERNLEIMREAHGGPPCEVVGAAGSGMAAVLAPWMSCGQAAGVRAVLDHYDRHDGQTDFSGAQRRGADR